MTTLTLMATVLHRDLQARGVTSLCPADCEAIMARVLQDSARLAERLMVRPKDQGK